MSGQSLGPLSPAATYGDILNLNNQGQGLVNTPSQVQDGYGNFTNIYLASNLVNFNRSAGQFQLDGIALTASAATLNTLSVVAEASYILAASNDSLPYSLVINGGTGINVNAGGGNMNISVTGNLLGLQGLNSTGLIAQTGVGTYSNVQITGDATLTITNGNGVGGNPLLSVNPSTTVQKVNVLATGIQTSTRSNLNFIPGAGVGITITDNSGSNRTDITLSAVPTEGTVTSVSGTPGFITVTNPTTTPVIDIDSTYVGQPSITTLGTISTGTWEGSEIGVVYGGTGLETFTTAYGVICAGTTPTGSLQNAGTGIVGQVLTSEGNASLPTWQTISFDLSLTINQIGHGLSVGNIIQCTGSNTFSTAKADNAADAEVVGIVITVIDDNHFTFQYAGIITGLTVTGGEVYFLDPVTAGALTATAPTTGGQIRKPLLIALTSTTGLWINQLGQVL